MSSGSKVRLYCAEEQTPEVLPTTPVWKTIRRVTDGLTENVTTETSTSVADTRFRQGGVATEAEVTGNLEVELSVGLFDDFLSGVALNNWTSDVLNFGGDVRKTFTFVKVYSDINQVFIYRGVRINEFTMSIATTGKITATFGLMGTLFERTTTSPVVSPLPVPETVLVSALNVGDLTVNGETVVGTACMQSLELTINNNMEAIRCIGSQKLTATTYLEKIVDITLNTQYMFSAQSAGYIDYIKTRDTMPINFSIEDKDGNGYAFEFPQLEVAEANHPDGGGEDTITIDINYNHIRVSPIITRVIAPVTP
ncbi:phage tail tube protein [Acinetobacter pittii]|uniref:phage tail tube protein n=1 Tax=Acinetobacter pittii TaxID=48296 RepID=UPI00266445DF|nr:phage tail tube protein [Acinetobacter pittii]MDO0888523.1 phage tail tube protein [Acinetobacter pittii]WPP92905.1 phage tail tube protein [Acinetobacter pittii]